MARDLKVIDKNSITLFDPVEKSEVVFFHRTPTTDDRVRYMAGRYKRAGGQLIDRSRTAAVDAAADVLTGIRLGDFTYDGRPLSSDPESEHYREDWKELVKNVAGDLLFLMGHDLFEGRISLDRLKDVTIVSEFSEETPGAGEEGKEAEELPPLPKSSGGSGTDARRNAGKDASKATAPKASRKSAGAAQRGSRTNPPPGTTT